MTHQSSEPVRQAGPERGDHQSEGGEMDGSGQLELQRLGPDADAVEQPLVGQLHGRGQDGRHEHDADRRPAQLFSPGACEKGHPALSSDR
jgi:hypothetical protein